MNPSTSEYLGVPHTTPPNSEANHWNITRSQFGSITVSYDVVISGIVGTAAPHINGSITLMPPSADHDTLYSFVRDGFPWAEAYFHDGRGNVETIFQDAAARGIPHDLFAIEPNIDAWRLVAREIGNAMHGAPIVNKGSKLP